MPDDSSQPKLGKWGGARVRGEQASNRNLKGGTNRAYVLARLRRDQPELAARVDAGEMSAHAAAVELGWAKRPQTVHGEDCNQARRRPFPFDPAAMIG